MSLTDFRRELPGAGFTATVKPPSSIYPHVDFCLAKVQSLLISTKSSVMQISRKNHHLLRTLSSFFPLYPLSSNTLYSFHVYQELISVLHLFFSSLLAENIKEATYTQGLMQALYRTLSFPINKVLEEKQEYCNDQK